MNSGFFLPMSSNYRLAWLWGIIVLSFERIVFYELDKESNWLLTLIFWLSIIAFLVLIWPHRFFISQGHFYFPFFPRLKMADFEIRHISAVRITRFGCGFSYAGKRYHFLTFGKSKAAFEKMMDHGETSVINA